MTDRDDATADSPIYLFSLRAAEKDISGYYVTQWDRARPLAIQAPTQQEAITKADALLPTLRHGWAWSFQVDTVTEIPAGTCNHCTCKETPHD